MALANTVKPKKVKKTKSRKTSPGKKGEKLGRQQPKKKVTPKKKNTAIESETEGYILDDDMSDVELDEEFDDTDYDSDDDANYPDKEY